MNDIGMASGFAERLRTTQMTADEILSILKRPSAVDYMIEMRDALERHFVESEKKFLKQRKGMKKTEQADARPRQRDSFNKLQRKQP